MNINELKELAQDVGMAVAPAGNGYWDNSKQLSDFANAIEARTKEKCAKLAHEMSANGSAGFEIGDALRALP